MADDADRPGFSRFMVQVAMAWLPCAREACMHACMHACCMHMHAALCTTTMLIMTPLMHAYMEDWHEMHSHLGRVLVQAAFSTAISQPGKHTHTCNCPGEDWVAAPCTSADPHSPAA